MQHAAADVRSIVTALITSTFVARATRDYDAARANEGISDAERIERRFDELERKLDLLAAARDTPGIAPDARGSES